MKKILSTLIAGALIASMVFTGCSDISVEEDKTQDSKESISFGNYSKFGAELKSRFENSYKSYEKRSLDSTEYIDFNDETSLIFNENESSSNFLLRNGHISVEAAAYIDRIESFFNNEEINIDTEAVNIKITAIEQKAMEKLSGKDLDAVMYYAEAAKASVSFFSENAINNFAARWSWKKIRKIRNIVVSVAVSSTIGGALGFALSGGNKIIAGASALTSGFYAGVKSNETGEICICGAYKKNK